jgi:hypothetical protein
VCQLFPASEVFQVFPSEVWILPFTSSSKWIETTSAVVSILMGAQFVPPSRETYSALFVPPAQTTFPTIEITRKIAPLPTGTGFQSLSANERSRPPAFEIRQCPRADCNFISAADWLYPNAVAAVPVLSFQALAVGLERRRVIRHFPATPPKGVTQIHSAHYGLLQKELTLQGFTIQVKCYFGVDLPHPRRLIFA